MPSMLSKDKEAALQKICSAFGGNIEYSQGGGTNASAKEGELMIIKASGYTLADMMSRGGYVELRYQPIAEIYTGENSITEDEARRITQSAVQTGSKLKPSIETGFHSFLPTFVIHLHPIYLIAVLCLENCEAILRERYGELNFVVANYQRPGHYLSREVARVLKGKIVPDTQIIFLKNHGLIVSSNDADVCLKTAREVCERAKEYVLRQTGTPALVYSGLTKDGDGYLGSPYQDTAEYLYPDAVVFLHDIKEKKGPYAIKADQVHYNLPYEQAKNIDEVLFAHTAIVDLAQKLGPYRALSARDVQELIEMEEEKYRKTLISQ